MYIVDKDNNKMLKAEPCLFSDLKLHERPNLQEWIAKEPSSLGEDLLIIQKEFDGFANTKERLDLLALDKFGNLVVIENKIDDSGRDVTWQALKYASYCASLEKNDIIDIYQAYLDKYCQGGNAKDLICDFYDGKELEDISLNDGESNLRIFLVAGCFPREVTSTVIWLRNNFNVRISCFEVALFTYNGHILVDFNQIIPIRGAEEYTIKLANKKKEEEETKVHTAKRFAERTKFWNAFVEYNKQVGGPFAESKVTTDNWIPKGGIGFAGIWISVVITRDNCRTEVYISTGEQTKNKRIFDYLYSRKSEIEAEIPGLVWQRLDERVTCRVRLDLDKSYQDSENYDEIFNFFISNTNQMIQTFSKHLKSYKH